MSLNDPQAVRAEYATEKGLAGRASAYRWADGTDPHDVVWTAIAEVEPKRALEVGCGRGELAERIERELGAEIVAVDQSERMVELARARGVEALLGDVQDLPFDDGEFDVAVAAWMLYHVPDLDRGLAELARVLRGGGRLVAVTNSGAHVRELYELLAVARPPLSFAAENAGELLRRHFSRVESRAALGTIDFPNREAAQAYVDATVTLRGEGRQLPPLDGALRVTRAPYVFVAEK